jgi:hypothetical protein
MNDLEDVGRESSGERSWRGEKDGVFTGQLRMARDRSCDEIPNDI